MKHILVALLIVVAALGCTQKPAPVANDTVSTDPAERLAIAVEYVAVPTAIIYSRPAVDAEQVGAYGLTEAVSILEKKGEWVLVRTYDGTGWIKQADLVDGATAAKMDTATPRFYVTPKEVTYGGRGEIAFQARVNTDGAVVEVKTIKNTTGSSALADLNANALKEAKFYPMVDKGARKTFVYEHHVYY